MSDLVMIKVIKFYNYKEINEIIVCPIKYNS